MVLFYSKECQHSLDFLPVYDNLDRKVNHILLFKMNIDTMENREVVDRSAGTIDELEYTPTVIFYQDGKPVSKLEGVMHEHDLRRFIQSVNESIQASTRQIMERGGDPDDNVRLYFINPPPNMRYGRTPVKQGS